MNCPECLLLALKYSRNSIQAAHKLLEFMRRHSYPKGLNNLSITFSFRALRFLKTQASLHILAFHKRFTPIFIMKTSNISHLRWLGVGTLTVSSSLFPLALRDRRALVVQSTGLSGRHVFHKRGVFARNERWSNIARQSAVLLRRDVFTIPSAPTPDTSPLTSTPAPSSIQSDSSPLGGAGGSPLAVPAKSSGSKSAGSPPGPSSTDPSTSNPVPAGSATPASAPTTSSPSTPSPGGMSLSTPLPLPPSGGLQDSPAGTPTDAAQATPTSAPVSGDSRKDSKSKI